MDSSLSSGKKRPRSNDSDSAWRRIVSKVLFLVRNVALMTLELSRPGVHEQPEAVPREADPISQVSDEDCQHSDEHEEEGEEEERTTSTDSDSVDISKRCDHRITTRTGTNQFVSIVRCVYCRTIISQRSKVRNLD